MNNNKIYCTYVTFYSGNKLPPFYIGSSSTQKIEKGYRGSVRSRKFKTIWKSELKENPNMFTTEIIETFETRKEALEHELILHMANDVVKSKWFINMAYATVNGCHGADFSGETHWNYNTPRPKETRDKISLNHIDVSGNKNPRARTIEVTSPSDEVTICVGNLKKFCKDNLLGYSTMNHKLYTNRKFNYGSSVGWSIRHLD